MPRSDPPVDRRPGREEERVTLRAKRGPDGGDRARLGAAGPRRVSGGGPERLEGMVSQTIRLNAVAPDRLGPSLNEFKGNTVGLNESPRFLEFANCFRNSSLASGVSPA